MHAADVVETLPTARPDDDALTAVQMVIENNLPGLIVADDTGVIGCLSSIDLLLAALPRYLQDDPGLARVFDEEHADRIAERLVGKRVRDILGEAVNPIPIARGQATVVEVAEQMVQSRTPVVLVQRQGGDTLGVVTANGLLGLLATAAGDAGR